VTFSRLWAYLAVALPVLAALIATMSTLDLAYQVRAGEMILESGAVLRTDPFTFTAAGSPWLDQQWGAQVLLALGFRAGGWAALAILRAALVGLTTGLVYLACRWEGAGRRVGAWLALGGFLVAAVAMGLRPQLLGMALFAATLAILSGRRRHPQIVWLIPVLACIWVNVHGSFCFAPVAVAVASAQDHLDQRPGTARLAGIAILSLAATVVGPFGAAVWPYALGVGTNPVIRHLVSEWQPTSPVSGIGLLFYGSAIAVVAVIVVASFRSRSRPGALRMVPWCWFAWLGGLFVLGVFAERGLAWWALAAPVVVAGFATRIPSPGAVDQAIELASARRTEPSSRLNAAIAALLAFTATLLLPIWRPADPLVGPPGLLTDAPAAVVRSLVSVATPADRVWNPQVWGSWLELVAPGIPLAVDSRIEVIPVDVWDDVLALDAGSPDWAAILDRRHVTILVVSKADEVTLLRLLRASPAWRSIHDDADGSIFVRANRP
jgi:hypothetical protein